MSYQTDSINVIICTSYNLTNFATKLPSKKKLANFISNTYQCGAISMSVSMSAYISERAVNMRVPITAMDEKYGAANTVAAPMEEESYYRSASRPQTRNIRLQ